jgi:hypothetical protein
VVAERIWAVEATRTVQRNCGCADGLEGGGARESQNELERESLSCAGKETARG